MRLGRRKEGSSPFLQKRTKKPLLALSRTYPGSPRQAGKGFLLLFLKKEDFLALP
jgi:hypothetical protein